MITVDELIAATINRHIVWSRDPDPVAVVHGRTIFVGAHNTYLRSPKGWETLGPADDLRRAIHNTRVGT